jgi:hypothetical protein
MKPRKNYHFSASEKLDVLDYCKQHGRKNTVRKYKSRYGVSNLYRWCRSLEALAPKAKKSTKATKIKKSTGVKNSARKGMVYCIYSDNAEAFAKAMQKLFNSLSGAGL